jgi:membrane protein YqaA with SNARE-associated domain
MREIFNSAMPFATGFLGSIGMVYATLFASAFLAATILPGLSETGLAVFIASGEHSLIGLILAASIGNTLGSAVNWFLGTRLDALKNKSWFPVKAQSLDRAKGWYQRYGVWSLLLSWVPIIGDPITVASGFFRTPFWVFLSVVAVAKTTRYLVVMVITLEVI